MSSVSRYSPVEKTGFLDCPVWPLVLLSHNSGIWDVLKVGEFLRSADKIIRLTMQRDCNLVLSDKQNSRVLWSSKTAGHGSKCFLRLQSDNKLVIYKGSGKGAVWAINQDCGQGGVKFSFLVIEDDGNLVLYRSQEGKLNRMWATKTKI
ncbi:mannose-specific lectin-like [Cryptomeria japonica]|uniref:mannose-specific lectin-like n=1 Tax=Cryptomeria japonica TaxID=3369 RepID=UPI0027DA364E|nr:mannose-specific lectin-like [Cryptomeria japonica]